MALNLAHSGSPHQPDLVDDLRYRSGVAGASEATVRVTHVNANWIPGTGFELLIVTEDDERRSMPISADDLAALGAVLSEERVLLWDPEVPTLITANVVGPWLPQNWSSRR